MLMATMDPLKAYPKIFEPNREMDTIISEVQAVSMISCLLYTKDRRRTVGGQTEDRRKAEEDKG